MKAPSFCQAWGSHYVALVLVFLLALFWLTGARAGSVEQAPIIDLGTVSPEENLALDMLGFNVSGEGHVSLRKAMNSDRWQEIRENTDILEKPRQHSTLWLKAQLTNSSDEHVMRWLDLSPWRLNEVNSWLVEPQSLEVRKEVATGLTVPIDRREIDSNKAVIPLELSPGESLLLVTRVFSDSRPFLDISSWRPTEFTMNEMAEWQFHSMLLAAILTLFAVLLITLDFRYVLLGTWLLVIFIFESEKEGYISQVVVSGLFDYSANLRFSTWILSEALFMVTSVYVLGINKRRVWRWFLPVLLIVTAVFSALTFVLDGAVIRNVGNSIDLSFSLIWLMMIASAFRVDRQWQYVFIGVLSLWWLVSKFILIGYVTNLYYTASFAEIRIFSGIVIILSLLIIYSKQKRDYEVRLEQKLRESERGQRESLERLVARRTHDLNQALADAHRANEEKTLFLGRISHDLKSPLTSVSGYAQLLCAEDGQPGAFGRIIHSSATHMNKLIDRLIGYARGAVSNREKLSDIHVEDFFSVIRQEAEVLARSNSNRFFLDVKVGDFSIVRCDEVSLRQVVINLIDNSAKYTNSGDIFLEVECQDAVGETGRMALRMTFRDTGRGISKELQKRLYEPFARESRHSAGTGLGLAIVKDLVATQEGRISLRSELGSGTEVRVWIPIEIGDEAGLLNDSPSMPESLLPSYHVNGLTAWVVEDIRPILDLLCGDLSSMGFNVQGFQSGREAIQAIQEADALPDLIVTDYRLQSVSGDEVLIVAKAKYPMVPVMLISATWRVLRSSGRSADGQGYDAYLSKPINLADFRREVARICDLTLEEQQVDSAGEGAASDAREPSFQQLERLLALGAVSDILDWCDAFADTHPGRASLVASIREQAERGNFSAILTLVNSSL